MSLIIGFTCNSYENAYFVIFIFFLLNCLVNSDWKKNTFHSDTKDRKKPNSTLKLVAKIQVYENEYSLYSWKK